MNTVISQQDVVIRHCGLAPAHGRIEIASWDKRARTLKALKFWGLFWGAAIMSVFIPVAHFVLVPLCILLGPIAAFLKWRQTSEVLGGEGHCPACGATFAILKQAARWPLADACPACKSNLEIIRKSE